MSIMDQLKRIRCVSEFEDREIDDVCLSTIVETATWIPSASDAQPWEIIAICDHARKEAVIETLLDSHLRPNAGGRERRSWVAQAPVLLVVCLDRTRAKARFGEIGEKLFGIQDTGAMIQSMRLVALEHGVKSCLIHEFDRNQMAELLELPRHVQPLVMLALGYSHVDLERGPRLPLEDFLHFEKW